MIRDLFRMLSREWGSKARKEMSRAKKRRLRLVTREELDDTPTDDAIRREVDALPNPEGKWPT